MSAVAPAFRPLVVIPVYDHEHAIGAMVDGVLAVGQSCLLVDDGSRESCAAELRRQAAREGVRLLRLEKNRGKGGAMLAGFREAARLGASHVLQIDADGQHDATDIPRVLQAAQAAPDAVINGAPVYDASAACRTRGMSAVSCWPSASICSTWLWPRRPASRRPAITAAPLPWLGSSRSRESQAGSAAARARSTAAQAGPEPSSTSRQGTPWFRSRPTSGPMACSWS